MRVFLLLSVHKSNKILKRRSVSVNIQLTTFNRCLLAFFEILFFSHLLFAELSMDNKFIFDQLKVQLNYSGTRKEKLSFVGRKLVDVRFESIVPSWREILLKVKIQASSRNSFHKKSTSIFRSFFWDEKVFSIWQASQEIHSKRRRWKTCCYDLN